jgi:hypothetical protein
MRSLKPVAPAQIGAVWPRLRAPMSEIESPDGWLAEDVYCTLRQGGATLYLVEIEGEEVGFVVLRQINDFDGPRLHIWLLHSRSDVDVMAEFSDELDNIARHINASVITFGTTRRGWAKIAPRHRFTVRETVYQRKIKS